MKRYTRYTDEEIAIITEYYPAFGGIVTRNKLIEAGHPKRSTNSVTQKANKMGLQSLVNRGRFTKGLVPHNKGKKISKELYEKLLPTMFKKGEKPHNAKYDGAITERIDTKTGLRYKYIRVAEKDWRLLQRYNWEKQNGSIPEGHVIIFKDGNQANCNVENLQCISMEENLNRVMYGDTPTYTAAYIVGRLAPKDKELQQQLLTMPEVLDTVRQQFTLRHEIRKQKKNIKRSESK